jgi:hypothetical protein
MVRHRRGHVGRSNGGLLRDRPSSLSPLPRATDPRCHRPQEYGGIEYGGLPVRARSAVLQSNWRTDCPVSVHLAVFAINLALDGWGRQFSPNARQRHQPSRPAPSAYRPRSWSSESTTIRASPGQGRRRHWRPACGTWPSDWLPSSLTMRIRRDRTRRVTDTTLRSEICCAPACLTTTASRPLGQGLEKSSVDRSIPPLKRGA